MQLDQKERTTMMTVGQISGLVMDVGSDDTNLYAVNAADGKKLWQFGTGAQVLSTPAVSTDQQIV